MKLSGEAQLQSSVQEVWDALLDPAVLVRTIPGCERLETTGENAYEMTVTAGVAAVRGTYNGTCRLHDLHPGESLVLNAKGAGTPGTIEADVTVNFKDNGDGTTHLTYDAVAVVGGMIGGVGQRMLSSVSKRLAAEFFSSINDVLTGAAPAPTEQPAEVAAGSAPAETGASASSGAVFTAPASSGGGGGSLPGGDFVQGALLGGGLVLAGVVAGVLAARSRR